MVSHSHDDGQFVSRLVLALTKRGVDVWYDDYLHPGANYRNEIRERIITSKAVLVVWSNSACNSTWVQAEADLAGRHEKLIQVVSEQCELPLPFSNQHYADLTCWNGDPHAEEISKIVDRIKPLPKSQPHHDDDALAETRRTLADEARIEVHQFIAKGDVSKVYLGRYGTRFVSIKAVNEDKLLYLHRDDFSREIDLASYLHDPTFLRISGIIYRQYQCFIVTDYTDGETIARKMNLGATFSIEDVVVIVYQLCNAIAEAHARGLRHLRIIPSEIFVYVESTLNRHIARISPINFAYFIERLQMDSAAHWRDESGPFMAPELWHDPSWFNERMGLSLEGEALERAMYQKANQFALGMVAWTMLDSQVPFTIPEGKVALTKIQKFLRGSEKFSEQVLEAKWRGKARALARIVARMVAADPAKRWQDMKKVSLLIGALAADLAANDLDDVVKEAYQRTCRGNLAFYSRFYEHFFRRNPTARLKFPVDMTRQHQMLDFALGQLLNYRQEQSEPTTLTQFVQRHSRLGLTEDDFEHFGEALIETFDYELKGDIEYQRTAAALEIVIWPGIHYLIQQCVPAAAT
jgi:serine/threonine protein kinase